MGILDKVGGFFEDLWNAIKKPFLPKPQVPSSGNGSGNSSSGDSYYDKKNEGSLGAMNYILNLRKPKTFDEWLTEQGLSKDVKNENYFGNYYKKSSQTLIDQAYSNMQKDKIMAESRAESGGLASHNAYERSSSNFSANNEKMFGQGFGNSGFSNYLKGLSYLAYRDDINQNRGLKENALADASNKYTDFEAKTTADRDKQIADREKELYDQYLASINQNKNLISKLY